MKDILVILGALLTCLVIRAQGSDIVFMIDNSGSIDTTEYSQISASITQIIEDVISCNEDNEVAVVHYANGSIFIESDFTDDIAIAQNFIRRLNGTGNLHLATRRLGDALDTVPNTGILSPQTSLNQNISNNLRIFIFTDDVRPGLVNAGSPIGSNIAFEEYTNFKYNRSARFTVVHFPPIANNGGNISRNAGAAIASGGGYYNIRNGVENYRNDPAGPGSLPRSYYLTSDFMLSQQEIDLIVRDLCDEPCDPVTNERIDGSFFRWDSYSTQFEVEISPDDIYNSADTDQTSVVIDQNRFSFLTSNSSVDLQNILNQIIQAGDDNWCLRVRAVGCEDWTNWFCFESTALNWQIEPNPCLDQPVLLSVTNDIQDSNESIEGRNIEANNVISGNSNVEYLAGQSIILQPGFHTDNNPGEVNFVARIDPCIGEIVFMSRPEDYDNFKYAEEATDQEENIKKNKNVEVKSNFLISPNPSNGLFIINFEEKISGLIEVFDYKGKSILKKEVNNKYQIQIDITKEPNGRYFIKLISDDVSDIKQVIKK